MQNPEIVFILCVVSLALGIGLGYLMSIIGVFKLTSEQEESISAYDRLYRLIELLHRADIDQLIFTDGITCKILDTDIWVYFPLLTVETSDGRHLEIKLDKDNGEILKLEHNMKTELDAFELIASIETAVSTKQCRSKDLIIMLSTGGDNV